ncbi:MAG: hypothetical protein KDK39_18355, partial [Leptospiraceae bacterium]|nr:hypothetical protein [Leptospiraceae bacterium]
MASTESIHLRLQTVFQPQQAQLLAEVISDSYNELVKTSDFNELKAVVHELADAQKRTEQRVEALAVAQQKTDQRVAKLTVAQQKTEKEL